MQLSGNTILITGGTSGIGLAFAEAFLAEGSTVIICGRREDRLQALKEKHPQLITKVCDLASTEQRIALAEWTIKHHPAINVLMNNAGVQLAFDLKQPVDVSRVYTEVDTNLIAPIHLSSLFVSHLSQQQNAVLINISSGLAFVPLAFMPVYCATKAAIHSFTLSLRHQLRDTGIKVFEVAPPSTDTELGHDRRTDKNGSHGGLPIADFIKEAMEALRNDILEAPIADSKKLREKGEAMFPIMNQH